MQRAGPPMADSHEQLAARMDLDGAQRAIGDVALRTPTLPADALSEAAGGSVVLKAECFQRTGSFKLRGALNKVSALSDREGRRTAAGVVTASAGNHGQAVAFAARARGLSCEVFMPIDAAVSKVSAVEQLGARVRLGGETVDEAITQAKQRGGKTGATFVHPFDDLDVIAGQGTLGLELLDDEPGLSRVIVPVGGGGLAAGVGLALRRRPGIELVGVQAQACAPWEDSLRSRRAAVADSAVTIADGIAVKRPGRYALTLLLELLDDLRIVSEEEIAQGMVFLAERAKLVAEGAGAVGVAALLAGALAPTPGTTAVVISGGNVDSGLLASVLRRQETEAGRRVRVYTLVPDRPGGLAELLSRVAAERVNLLSIEHLREGVSVRVRETGVELTLETRGPEHTDQLLTALRSAGYEVRVDDEP